MKHFSWLNKKGTTETCCASGLCITKDQDERIRLLQKIANDKDKEEKIEELGEGNEEDKEKKDESRKAKEHEKLIQAYRAELDDMDKDEMDELISQLKAQIEELRKKLNPETDQDKQSKEASLEFIGVDTYHSVGKDGDVAAESLVTLQNQRNRKKKSGQSYNILTLDQNYHESKRGDSLLQRMGSVD